MSLFAQLNSGGIRQPDAVINGSSSLLPSSGAAIQLTNAKINQTSNLLGNISPYDYGPGRVSDDIVYKPVPHKIQKIVPQIELPGMNESTFKLSHAVDDGDIAFALRTPHNARRQQIKDYNWFSKQHLGRAVDAIVNLPTLNYILAGLQYPPGGTIAQWENFYSSVAVDENTIKFADFQDPLKKFHAISCFVRDCVRPIGIVIGSENQGGQHQGNGAGAVDWPTDFVVTILVQGLCDNTANHWRCCEISAGDDLMLALAHTFPSDSELQSPHLRKDDHKYGEGWKEGNFQKPKANQTYTLNHWRYGTIRQTLDAKPDDFKNLGLVELIPASTTEVSKPWLLQAGPNVAEGVWHIARSQVMASSFARHEMAHAPGYRDDTQNLRGGPLIECQVDPLWESINENWWKHVFEKEKRTLIKELEDFIETRKPTTGATASAIKDADFEKHVYKTDKIKEILKKTAIGKKFVDNIDKIKPKIEIKSFNDLQTFYENNLDLDIKLLFFTAQNLDRNLFDFVKVISKKLDFYSSYVCKNTRDDKISITEKLNSFFAFFYFLMSQIDRKCAVVTGAKFETITTRRYVAYIYVQALMKTITLQGEWSDSFLINFTKYFDENNFDTQKQNVVQKHYTSFLEKLGDQILKKTDEDVTKIDTTYVHAKELFDGSIHFAFHSHIDDSTLPQSSNNTTSSFPTELAQRASVPLSAGAGAGREKETAGAAKKGEAASGDAGDGGRAPKAARKGAVAARRVGGAGGSSGARVLGGVRVVPAGEDEEGE